MDAKTFAKIGPEVVDQLLERGLPPGRGKLAVTEFSDLTECLCVLTVEGFRVRGRRVFALTMLVDGAKDGDVCVLTYSIGQDVFGDPHFATTPHMDRRVESARKFAIGIAALLDVSVPTSDPLDSLGWIYEATATALADLSWKARDGKGVSDAAEVVAGSTVELKSGGPRMTAGARRDGVTVWCYWHGDDGRLLSAEFPVAVLEVVR